MVPDGKRIGRTLRAIRRHLKLRQIDLARMVGVSQSLVSRVERGILIGIRVETLVQLFAALGARLELRPWWEGASLDRLLDARHAALTEFVVGVLRSCGWAAHVEITFAVYRERGSIDIVGWHAPTRTLLIIEIKTEFGSMEETLRRFDVKVRLARRIVEERFGWAPSSVSRLLVLQDLKSNRRHAADLAASLAQLPTVSGWRIRAWLREPLGTFSALWFASPGRGVTASRGSGNVQRVRPSRSPYT
ncbi:MAG: helix-turn-helix transcriptional regulator [Chloroflexi bacterium]|nr:helix-turn-helix transcriptional regulator [Chloroflexota bacterium]